MYNVPAVIFAGGKSSRMGQDKALLPFGGEESLAAYQYKKLKRMFQYVYLSSKEAKFGLDAPVLYDRYTHSSPLVALVSAFESLQADEIFVLGVDLPCVPQTVITELYNHRDNRWSAVVAQSPLGIQPLCGFYQKEILAQAQENLAKGRHRLMDLLTHTRTLPVVIQDEKPFINLNTPQEYHAALNITPQKDT